MFTDELDDSKQISELKPLINDALAVQMRTGKKQLVQVVVYNLPDRDCSAKASDGEFHLSDDGLNKYKRFIDSTSRISSFLTSFLPVFIVCFHVSALRIIMTIDPDFVWYYLDVIAELSTVNADKLQFSLILEPDSLGNLITNMEVPKCANAANAYREATAYVRCPLLSIS